MNKNLLKIFFSSGVQAISVQVLGVLFIAIVAKVLPKEQFGIIQWANVTAIFITTILGFGMEQVVVRRIAASSGSDWAAGVFLLHNLVGSILSLALTFLLAYLIPDENGALQYLPLFFAAQAVVFSVTPMKQFLNAKHLFAPYGFIALFSNSCKIILAFILMKFNALSVSNVGNILLGCASIEFIALFIYVHKKTTFRIKFKFIAYKKLLKESMPQFMAVVFDSSLSRLDMMLLGIIGGSYVAMGEYGFAYRAFEMARLPVVIIAPIILNVFSKMLSSGKGISDEKQHSIKELYNLEMFFAVLIPLALNVIWSPLLDYFFDNKYGTANANEFMLLSVCIPLHFFINLLWSICFANRKYKKIASLTMISAIANLILNLILIPYLGGLGAAIAFLITTIFQAILYYSVVKKQLIHLPIITLSRFIIVAAVIFIFVSVLPVHTIFKLLLATTLYIAVCIVFKWVDARNYRELKKYLVR